MTHLTLDECKELKKRGFPQDTYSAYSESWGPDISIKINWPDFTKRELKKLNIVACPTLEELTLWIGQPYCLNHLPNDTYEAGIWDENQYSNVVPIVETSRTSMLQAVYKLSIAIKPVIKEV